MQTEPIRRWSRRSCFIDARWRCLSDYSRAGLGFAAMMNLWPGRLSWVLIGVLRADGLPVVNVYAAMNHVPFGGHEARANVLTHSRSRYLCCVLGWTYLFFIRNVRKG